MDAFRLTLFLGLAVHKGLWELLKKRDRVAKIRPLPPSLGFLTRSIKLLKALALVFFGFQTLFLDLFPITEQPSTLRAWGMVIYFLGLGTAVLGRLQLGQNWIDLEDYQVLPQQSLTTKGVYGYIRHPIYTGDILLLIGLQLALNSWLVLAVAIPLLIAVKQALVEETLLSQAFPSYRTYCKRTKRFIPFIA